MHRPLLLVLACALGAGCSLGLDFDRDYPGQGGIVTSDGGADVGAADVGTLDAATTDAAPNLGDGGRPRRDATPGRRDAAPGRRDAAPVDRDAAPPDVRAACELTCRSLATCLRRADAPGGGAACPGLALDPNNAAFFEGACVALCVTGGTRGLEPGADLSEADCAPVAASEDFESVCTQGSMCSDQQCPGVTNPFGLCTEAGVLRNQCLQSCQAQREDYWRCLGQAYVLQPGPGCGPYDSCDRFFE